MTFHIVSHHTANLRDCALQSTAGFMATELLKRPPSSSFARRTVSHDLQSFCWVLICVSFKHAAVELKTKSASDIKDIAGFDNMNFRQEFHALFSAAPGSAKDLATKRKVAFQQESSTGQALAYAGIENLHNYVESKDVALAAHLRIIWHFLKMCEPLQTVGVDQKLTAEERAFLRRVTGNAPDAEASNAQFRAFAMTFNHANFIGALEMALRDMADSEQATSGQST